MIKQYRQYSKIYRQTERLFIQIEKRGGFLYRLKCLFPVKMK